jgi:hypothetical protein
LLVREGGAGKREEDAAGTLAEMSKAKVSCGWIEDATGGRGEPLELPKISSRADWGGSDVRGAAHGVGSGESGMLHLCCP